MLEGFQGFFQTMGGQYHQALVRYKFTLVCAFSLEGHDSLEVAASFNNLVGVYDSLGHYERALEYYRKDLDFTVRLVGGDHLDVAKVYNGMWAIYYGM
jgi:tetratricopeptide (TPR) repeat protein